MRPESLPTLWQSPSGSCPVPRAGAGRSRAEWDARCRASLHAASQGATWLYAAGEEAGEGMPWYAPGKEPATLAVCVQDLEGCECDLEERECAERETELRQNSGKASHGSLSIRQSGR